MCTSMVCVWGCVCVCVWAVHSRSSEGRETISQVFILDPARAETVSQVPILDPARAEQKQHSQGQTLSWRRENNVNFSEFFSAWGWRQLVFSLQSAEFREAVISYLFFNVSLWHFFWVFVSVLRWWSFVVGCWEVLFCKKVHSSLLPFNQSVIYSSVI